MTAPVYNPGRFAANWYPPQSMEACLWHAMHAVEGAEEAWKRVPPAVADADLRALLVRRFGVMGFSAPHSWSWAAGGGESDPRFAATPPGADFGAHQLTHERRPHPNLLRGGALLIAVRALLWGPANGASATARPAQLTLFAADEFANAVREGGRR